MKTELRIGNKILLGNEVVDVLEIWSNGLRVTNSGTGCGYTYDQFSPIALTEEWLLKFGFEKNYEEEYYPVQYEGDVSYVNYANDSFYISFGANSMFCVTFYGGIKYLNYIHELQNLYFALTGKELTLKEIK